MFINIFLFKNCLNKLCITIVQFLGYITNITFKLINYQPQLEVDLNKKKTNILIYQFNKFIFNVFISIILKDPSF